MYPLMENQPYAAEMQRRMIDEIEAARPRFVVLVNVADRGTRYVWGHEAAAYTPTSPVWVAVFERKT